MRAVTIEDVLDRGVKDVIREYGEIGALLLEHRVGCVTCSVGTCRLRDVIEIHHLDEPQERELLTRVAQRIYPECDVVIPRRQRQQASRNAHSGWTPVMSILVDEHELIGRMLAIIPGVVAELNPRHEGDWRRVHSVLDFIRRYADQYHHAKEEEILFGYFDHDLEILKAMRHEHEIGRTLARQAGESSRRRDTHATREYLGSYCTLLNQHIEKENGILFPWLDRQLTDRAVGEIYERFNLVAQRNVGLPEEMARRIKELTLRVERI